MDKREYLETENIRKNQEIDSLKKLLKILDNHIKMRNDLSYEERKTGLAFLLPDELYKKKHSNRFKEHPLYPILVKDDGTEIYDIRDGTNMPIRNNKNTTDRKQTRIRGIKGKKYVYHLVYEAWNTTIINVETHNVHHLDENRNNNHYTNLMRTTYEWHKELHATAQGEGNIESKRKQKNKKYWETQKAKEDKEIRKAEEREKQRIAKEAKDVRRALDTELKRLAAERKKIKIIEEGKSLRKKKATTGCYFDEDLFSAI